MEFRGFIKISEITEKYGSVLIPEFFDWAKGFSLPNLNLDLPSIEKKSQINLVMDKKDPIYIQLADGSKLFFTADEFKRIGGKKPERGKTMVFTMQRLASDKSDSPSQITKCQVI